MEAVGREQLTAANLAASIGLQSIPADALRAWISVADDPVRMELDGTAVTATTGIVLPGDNYPPLELERDQLADARFIAESGTPEVNVIYFGSNV